jgi:hypothetical protein
MTGHATEVARRFSALDRALQAKGFPATSPWWLTTIERFYLTGRRQLVVRAGRRAGKSSTLCRLAVTEALYGKHKIPPGDVGVVAFISTTRDEAAQRLRTIEAILGALGVKYRRSGDAIELDGRPVVFKCFTASVAGVSGFTAILVVADEVAKWRDADTGANPATEVLASVRPTMATQPEARIVLSSSPMATLDAHYDAFEQGDNVMQIVTHAPTWVANPTLTEADTRALESDEATWKREYAAIPMTELESSLFTDAMLTGATRKEPAMLEPEPELSYAAAMDPATRVNAWTLAVSTSRFTAEGLLKKSIARVQEWRGSKSAPLSPDQVLREIAAICGPYRVRHVTTDQWSGDAMRDIARRHGIHLLEDVATQMRKSELYEGLRTRIVDGQIELPPDPQVKVDLLAVRRKITRAGPTIELGHSPDGRHADYAPAIALAVDAYTRPPPAAKPELSTEEWERQAAEHRRQEHRRQQLRQHGNSRRRLEEHELRRAILRARG